MVLATEDEQAAVAEEALLLASAAPLIDPDALEMTGPDASELVDTTLATVATIAATVCFLVAQLLSSDMVDTVEQLSPLEKLRVLNGIAWLPSFLPNGAPDAELVLIAVMAAAAFAQALTGFGFAIVSVGALSSVPWLAQSSLYDVIAPLAATLGAVVGFILLLPNARRLDWAEIVPLLVPCTLLTPVGAWAATLVEPAVATKALAALIVAFVVYSAAGMAGAVATPDVCASEACALDGPEPPPLASRRAGYALGAVAGLFGGAFDVQGPPLAVWGNARGWAPPAFRDNVLCVVALNSALVVGLAQRSGALHNFYYSYFALTSLPGVLLGLWLGQRAAALIEPRRFKLLVLGMCLGLGLKLGLAP